MPFTRTDGQKPSLMRYVGNHSLVNSDALDASIKHHRTGCPGLRIDSEHGIAAEATMPVERQSHIAKCHCEHDVHTDCPALHLNETHRTSPLLIKPALEAMAAKATRTACTPTIKGRGGYPSALALEAAQVKVSQPTSLPSMMASTIRVNTSSIEPSPWTTFSLPVWR